jgi:hypothetical protein
MDSIKETRTVMFVGDYFTLLTTVALEEALRLPEETDEDEFAIRLAATWMGEHYGWDVLKASNEVGVVEDNEGFGG